MTDETFDQHPNAPTTPTDAGTAGTGHRSAADLPSRRTLLRGAAVAGAAVPFLAACAGGGNSGDNTSSETKKGQVLAKTSQVPEGGGIIVGDAGVVITQPSAGEFKGFSNICTHLGCQLAGVDQGTINCDCHGSMFSIEDGSVVNGPAQKPLPTKKIAVKGANITKA
jgi:Rieske Fe-S protein